MVKTITFVLYILHHNKKGLKKRKKLHDEQNANILNKDGINTTDFFLLPEAALWLPYGTVTNPVFL